MLSLRTALEQTGTQSMRELQRALSSNSSSLRRLILTSHLHHHYLSSGGRQGPLGFPVSDVQFTGIGAMRQYRGGNVQAVDDGPLGVTTQALRTRTGSVRFLGFKCLDTSNELSATDEPYFVATVDVGNGSPIVKKFGPFENVDPGDEFGVGDVIASGITPNPLSIKVMAYENDQGDPDETAKKIQELMVELSKEAGSIASGADAADGPGIGPSAAAGTIGAIAGGPLGALAAAGVVSALGLGDDFVGQDVALAFIDRKDTGTPPERGKFREASFNASLDIDGGDAEGHYELFFDIRARGQTVIATP